MGSRFGDLKIRDFGNPRRKTRPFPSIPAVSTPAKSKSDTAQSKRCLGPSPEPSRAVVAASRGENRRPQPRRRHSPRSGPLLANRPRPISLSRRSNPEVRPIRPNAPVRPSVYPGRFLLRAGSPTFFVR
ncbi:hypothetical protein CDL15_Pgr009406 [Punica granatum]|uniref:Uncharacterized protein n=1 Tax=Punica granatum TaxID=22663 RepID=A0A218WUW0_PUNGR|nr:hypothetical protein CDL15_Pgr009406 [Punica granatum]PKI60442.1 hypothetical protein CRG98_019096 [Punica granatum]